MKAVIQSRYGGPEILELQDVERPQVDDGEVLVRVHSASIHVGDWILMTGKPYVMRMATGLRKPKNAIPGTDIAGTVEAVGTGVERLAVGDEVFGWSAGAFAEYAVASQDQLVRKPANLTFEQASAVGVSATTALQLLRDHDIQPGQKVLVNGASGGVGTFAVQIAKSLGAIVTGVTSTSQYDESRGVRIGTSTINGRLPRIRAMPSIISRYVMTSGPPASNDRPSISSRPAAAAR